MHQDKLDLDLLILGRRLSIYAYDPLNRLTNVLSRGQLAAAYSYDLAGNLEGMQYGNGVTNRYQYDSLNRLTNLVWGTHSSSLANFAYTLMNGGTRTNAVEMTNGMTWNAFQWSFDNLYRLTNENINPLGSSTAKFGYSYDVVGNRLSRSSTNFQLAADSYSYDTNDELYFLTDSSGNPTTNGYDENGSTISAATVGGATNDYNYISALHWLVSETVNGNAAVFGVGYDGDGNRVFKGVQNAAGTQSTVTFYLVDDRNPSGYAQVLEEYQGVWTNNVTRGWARPVALSRAYNYGSALISQQQFDPTTLFPSVLSYYGYDGHGSVRFLMDTGGGMTDSYTFDAFGNLLSSTGGTPNNYLYCGQQWDSDLGLYYNRARYLNTGIGRFWTMDGDYGNNEDPLSLHKYLYAEDEPINNVDPIGNDIYKVVRYDSDDVGFWIVRIHHRIVVGDDGKAGSYTFEAGGNGSSPCRTAALTYTPYSKLTAVQVVKGLTGGDTSFSVSDYFADTGLFAGEGYVAGHVQTSSSTDSKLDDEANQLNGKPFSYLFLWNDCGTLANDWLEAGDTQEEVKKVTSGPIIWDTGGDGIDDIVTP